MKTQEGLAAFTIPGTSSTVKCSAPGSWVGSYLAAYHSGINPTADLVGNHTLNLFGSAYVTFLTANPTDIAAWVAQADKTDGYEVYLTTATNLRLSKWVNDGMGGTVETVLDNCTVLDATSRWFTLGLTVDHDGVSVYVDGVEVVTSDDTEVRESDFVALFDCNADTELSAFHILDADGYVCSGLEPRSWTVPGNLTAGDEYLLFPDYAATYDAVWQGAFPQSTFVFRTWFLPANVNQVCKLRLCAPDGTDNFDLEVTLLAAGPNTYRIKMSYDASTYDLAVDGDFPLYWELTDAACTVYDNAMNSLLTVATAAPFRYDWVMQFLTDGTGAGVKFYETYIYSIGGVVVGGSVGSYAMTGGSVGGFGTGTGGVPTKIGRI